MDIALLNGKPTALALTHRGLAFGDGLFETCLVSSGHIYNVTGHLNRLTNGCNALNIHVNLKSIIEQLNQLIKDVVEPHVLKVMILRTATGRGYDFDPTQQSSDTIITMTPYHKPSWFQGARLVTSNIPVTENAYLAGLKHLNRLDSVLSRQIARNAQVDDALMVTSAGLVIETTMANVFFQVNGQWLTPAIETAGVKGIIRQRLLQQFNKQILVQNIDRDSLTEVESAFMTNSLLGLVPIIELNQRPLKECQTITTFNQFVRQLRD